MKTICVKDEGFQSLRLKKKDIKKSFKGRSAGSSFFAFDENNEKVQIKPDNSDFANLIEIIKSASG